MFAIGNRWAVVTGASSGIGKQIALELARQGCHLVLVARRKQHLDQLAAVISERFGRQTVVANMDLTSVGAANELAKTCIKQNVSIVVNNAGIGLTGRFESNSSDDLMRMIRLNVLFLVEFTHRLFPHLKKHDDGARILNVGSVAGCQGVSFFAPYAATKAFINNLSQGLQWEQEDDQLCITCLQPSKTQSEFFEGSGMVGSRFLKRNVMSAERVAKIGVRAMIRGKHKVIPGFWNTLMVFSLRFSTPAMIRTVIRYLFRDLA